MVHQSNLNPGGTPLPIIAINAVRAGRMRRLKLHRTSENPANRTGQSVWTPRPSLLLGVEEVASSSPAGPTSARAGFVKALGLSPIVRWVPVGDDSRKKTSPTHAVEARPGLHYEADGQSG